jgi:multiple sugar transport system substrate-binding protein
VQRKSSWIRIAVAVSTLLILLAGMTSAADFEWVTKDRIGNPDAKTVITWGVRPEYSHQQPVQERVDYLVQRMEEWAKKNPDVQVEVLILPAQVDLQHARLLEQAAIGRAPDAAMIDAQYSGTFDQFLEPLDEYFDEEEINDFFPGLLTGGMVNQEGQLKLLWFVTNMEGLWYRQDLIPEPPKTWDEVIEVAQKLMAEEGFPIGFEYPAKGENAMYGSILPMFYAQGGQLVDADGQPTFNNAKNRAILTNIFNFYKRTIEAKVTPLRVVNIELTEDRIADPVADLTPLLIGGTWFQSNFYSMLGKDVADNKWGFAPVPQMTADQGAAVTGGWTFGVFAEDPVRRAYIVDFLNYVYVGPDGMAGWCEAAKYLPTRRSVYASYQYFQEDAVAKSAPVALENSFVRPAVKAYPVISRALQTALQEVLLGSKTPDKALDDAYRRVMQEL